MITVLASGLLRPIRRETTQTVLILSFAFFSRNSDGPERGGEDEPPKGSEPASATVRLRRLLQADSFNSQAAPEGAEAPASPATAERVVRPSEATDGSGSSESHAPSMAATIPVPASGSSSEHSVEQHRQDTSVLLAPVDAGHGSESEAWRSSEIEMARVQDETKRSLAQMNHQLAAATDKAQTAVALKNAAELEIGRIRSETEQKLAWMEQQLAAAGHQLQVEVARRRVTELEIARLREETSRRPLLRGDQAATIASDCTTAAPQPRGDDAPLPATSLKKPTTLSAKTKKTTKETTTSEARTKTVVRKPRTGTASRKPSKAASPASRKTAQAVSKRASVTAGKKPAVVARKSASTSGARAKTVVKKSR